MQAMGPIRIVAAALAVVILLLAAAAVWLLTAFDPNDYKGYLTSWVEERTGRTLVIQGDLQLQVFPWLSVETEDVTLGNAPGFDGAAPFATVERVAAEVKLLPLLGRRVEIGTVQLDGLRLDLVRNADGRGNWQDLGARSAASPAADDAEPGGSWTENLDAEGVRIRDGIVYWREGGDPVRYVASGISLETGAIDLAEPVDVSLAVDVLDVESQRTFEVEASSSVWLPALAAAAQAAPGEPGDVAAELRAAGFALRIVDAQQRELARGRLDAALVRAAQSGRVELGDVDADAHVAAAEGVDFGVSWSQAVFDPASGSLTVDGLATSAAGVDATWRLEGRNLIDAPNLGGSVSAASGSIAATLEALGVAPPEGIEPAALGALDASADFEVALAPADGEGQPGTSEAEALRLGPYRVAALRLASLDVRALGATLRGDAELDGGSVLSARVDVPELVPSEALLALGRAHAPDTIDVGAVDRVALATRIDADFATGRIALTETHAALLGAELDGALEILPGSGGGVYRGTVKTSRFEPERLARFLGALLSDAIEPSELGALAVDTRFDYDSAAGRLTLDPLSLEAFGLAAAGEAAVAGLGASPSSSGRLRVAEFSPRELMSRFGQAVPETSDSAALRRASIDARFEADAARGRFTGIELTLDDSRITGDFTVEGFEKPAYRFALAIDRVDADRYLPPRAADVPADAPAEAPTAGDIELPAEALANLDLNGTVSVGDLRLAGLEFQEVSTAIAIGGGEGRLDSAHAKLYGGEFDGTFHVVAGSEPGLTLTGRAMGLALEPMIVALTHDANFSGTGDFDLNLSGRGATVIENVRSANGSVQFALASGAIEGFNLGRSLCALYNATQNLPAPAQQPNATSYDVIRGTAAVRDGVASSSDLLARTSFMDVAGAGRLGLAEQRLDHDLEAKLTGSIGIPGCESMNELIGESIPFTLRGTVTDSEIRPDFSKIIERRVEDEIRKRLGDRLQDRLEDLLR